jgi:hypothetical protein
LNQPNVQRSAIPSRARKRRSTPWATPTRGAYSRNKRGIAGSLIWINVDHHALLNLFYNAKGKLVADKDEIRPQFQELSDSSAISRP